MLLSGAILLTGPGGVTVPLAFVSDWIRSLEPGLADAAFWWMAMAFLVTPWALLLAGPPCTRLMAGCGAGWPHMRSSERDSRLASPRSRSPS